MKNILRAMILACLSSVLVTAAPQYSKTSASGNQITTPVEPSKEFRAFVDGLKIIGVHPGEPQRILVDGSKMFRPGEAMQPTLGIKFVSIDPDLRIIVFEDKTGARYSRGYP